MERRELLLPTKAKAAKVPASAAAVETIAAKAASKTGRANTNTTVIPIRAPIAPIEAAKPARSEAPERVHAETTEPARSKASKRIYTKTAKPARSKAPERIHAETTEPAPTQTPERARGARCLSTNNYGFMYNGAFAHLSTLRESPCGKERQGQKQSQKQSRASNTQFSHRVLPSFYS